MHRRTAVAGLFALAASGCGGGGGGAAPVPAPAPAPISGATPPPAPAASLSPSIAMWGDSLTPPVAANLQLLYPNRAVYNGGISGETSTQIAARALADGGGHANWINVLWYGQNNETDPERIKADLAATIAALAPGNKRFLVLGVVNEDKPAEIKGGSTYATITRLNADLAALYPDNFFDMRAYLVSLGNLSLAEDVLDLQEDVVPASLRFDEIHLNNDGSVAVARKLKELIDARGW